MLMGAAKIAPARKWVVCDGGRAQLDDLRHGTRAYGRGGKDEKGLKGNGRVLAEGEPSRG